MTNNNLLEHLFKSLHLPKCERYNIYLVGSRLWGTNTKTSDWDLLIVGDIPSNQLTSIHKNQYDVKLIDRKEFLQQIKEGSILEIICSLIKKEDMIQHAFDIDDISIDLDSIKKWFQQRQIKDLDKAQKFWSKGNQQSGWKILRHILHGKALLTYLENNLHQKHLKLSIDDIQNIVQSATFLCQKEWMQMDWSDVHTELINALTHL